MISFKNKVQEEVNQLLQEVSSSENEVLSRNEAEHLPAPVKKWLDASGAVGREKAKMVWLKQKFLMKLKPDQKKWYKARAQQLFLTRKPAFIWTVRLRLMPLINILGRDKFSDGKGEMQMTVNGMLNTGKQTGSKMDTGTLQRFLGEIVWFPSAAVSSCIRWEAIDEFTAKATMSYKGTSGSGTFHFNKEGLLDKFVALRYMGNAPDARQYQWVIAAKKHEKRNGIKIPVELEATWLLEKGPWTWCNIEITDINYNIPQNSLTLF